MKKPDLTAIVTFHGERELAQISINSIVRTRAAIERIGVEVETIFMLDCADDLTRLYVVNHPARRPQDRIIEVCYGDLSASRNDAIARANGQCLAIFDGDDLYSEKWLLNAFLRYQEDGRQHVYHPEIIISFDAVRNYNFEVDQRGKQFDPLNLLMTNYWCSCSFADRQTFLDHPYVPKDSLDCGFGFEDWHWNCDTVASGLEHRIVPETALFYRRKRVAGFRRFDRK
jgi:glycosyltransferase involved in cell wall biosynthesis